MMTTSTSTSTATATTTTTRDPTTTPAPSPGAAALDDRAETNFFPHVLLHPQPLMQSPPQQVQQ